MHGTQQQYSQGNDWLDTYIRTGLTTTIVRVGI
jgi:hypothetical protein